MVVQLLRNDNVFVANSMSELSEERGELLHAAGLGVAVLVAITYFLRIF